MMLIEPGSQLSIPSFFNFTLQGMGIFSAIVITGWKTLKILRKIDRGFDIWNWQHLVMWTKFERENPVPPYPRLSWDSPDSVESHWSNQGDRTKPKKEAS